MKNLKFDVEGIHCGSCVSKIESNLSRVNHVEAVKASKEQQLVNVQGNDSLSAMKVKSSLEELGFNVLKMSKE